MTLPNGTMTVGKLSQVAVRHSSERLTATYTGITAADVWVCNPLYTNQDRVALPPQSASLLALSLEVAPVVFSCWRVVSVGGRVGGGFRCGSPCVWVRV